MITIYNIIIIQDKQVKMTNNQSMNYYNDEDIRFLKWKHNIDLIFQMVFQKTAINLPDMPYRDMFEENIEKNFIILRMFKLLHIH